MTFFTKNKNLLIIKIVSLLLILSAMVFFFSQISIARMTFIINDENNITIVESASSDIDEVIESAGILLDDNDSYTTSKTDSGNYNIIISRNINVDIYYGENHISTITHPCNILTLLTSLNISTSNIKNISPNLYSMLEEDCSIHLQYNDVTDDNLGSSAKTSNSNNSFSAVRVLTDNTSVQSIEAIEASVEVVDTHEIEEVAEVVEQSVPDSTNIIDENIDKSEPTTNYITTPYGEQIQYSYSINVYATAYSSIETGYNYTASGTLARVGAIAVDPSVIPLGTKMYITAGDGSWVYGYAVAEDTGGLIIGNKIDLYFDTLEEVNNFGYRSAVVYIIDN